MDRQQRAGNFVIAQFGVESDPVGRPLQHIGSLATRDQDHQGRRYGCNLGREHDPRIVAPVFKDVFYARESAAPDQVRVGHAA